MSEEKPEDDIIIDAEWEEVIHVDVTARDHDHTSGNAGHTTSGAKTDNTSNNASSNTEDFNLNFDESAFEFIDDPDAVEAFLYKKDWDKGRLGKYTPPKEPSADLPKFRPRIDKDKLWAHIDYSESVIIPDIVLFPVKAMRLNSESITMPVIEYADRIMTETGLREKFQELNVRALATLQRKDGGAEKARDILEKFSKNQENIRALTEYRNKIRELRDHVDETYKTNKERSKRGKDWATWRHDLSTGQKKELLKYLDDMEKLANDMADGPEGENGTEILDNLQRIKTGELKLTDVYDSVTGLSSSYKRANDAEIRLTNMWPEHVRERPNWPKNTREDDYTTATYQYKMALARSINEQVYNPYQNTGSPITYTFLRDDDNLEAQWQNVVLDTYAARGEDGRPIVNWNDAQTAENFLSSLLPFLTSGFGHDTALTMEQLAALRQAPGMKDIKNQPPITGFHKAIQAVKDANKNDRFFQGPEFDLYMGRLKNIMRRENRSTKGAQAESTGPRKLNPERYFGLNRQNRYRAELNLYPVTYAKQYPGTKRFALPYGGIDVPLRKRFAWQKPLFYFLGYAEFRPGETTRFSSKIKDWDNVIGKPFKDDEKSVFNLVRRSLLRILTVGFGTIDDWRPKKDSKLSFSPLDWIGLKPSKLALKGAALSTVGGLVFTAVAGLGSMASLDTKNWLGFSDGYRPQTWATDKIAHDGMKKATAWTGVNDGEGVGIPFYDLAYNKGGYKSVGETAGKITGTLIDAFSDSKSGKGGSSSGKAGEEKPKEDPNKYAPYIDDTYEAESERDLWHKQKRTFDTAASDTAASKKLFQDGYEAATDQKDLEKHAPYIDDTYEAESERDLWHTGEVGPQVE
ncbi:MAG: hypothetical protein OEY94_03210 [Alphaproteobacteria bacterium]|nr:hypothetical protein [Alphaproteobacteria bacterium]